MTVVTWLQDSVSNSGQSVRQATAVFAGVAPPGRPLGAYSGVRAGTPTDTTVTATSAQWTVNVHAGVLDLETSALAGPLGYAVTVAETGAMQAANQTNPRIDLLTVRSNMPDVGDGSSSPGVVPHYIPGTAAATPAVPVTPPGEMALATITVPSVNAGGAPVVTWVAPMFTYEPAAYAYYTQTAGYLAPNNAAPFRTVPGWAPAGTVPPKNIAYSSAGVWTVTVRGWYSVRGKIAYSPAGGAPAGQRVAQLQINGNVVSEFSTVPTAYLSHCPVSYDGPLDVGDTIQICVFQNQGINVQLATGDGSNYLSINREFTY